MNPGLNAVLQTCEQLYTPTSVANFSGRMLAALKPVLPSKYYSWELLTMADVKPLDARFEHEAGAVEWSKQTEPYREFAWQHPFAPVAVGSPAPQVVVRSELLPTTRWRRTDFYNEVLAPLEVGDQMALMFGGEHAMAALVLHHEREVPEGARRILRLLGPHIRQAMATSFRWDEARQGGPTSWGRIAVGFDGRIAEAEPATRALLARHFPPGRGGLPPLVRRWFERNAGRLWSGDAPGVPRDSEIATPAGRVRLTLLTEFGERRHVILVSATERASAPAATETLARLTPREGEVLGWIAEGKRNAEIAIILGSKPSTVKSQVEVILRKLGVETRGAAAAVWREGRG